MMHPLQKVKIYQPIEAIKVAKKLLISNGYHPVTAGYQGRSIYMMKMKNGKPIPGRIRISTHTSTKADNFTIAHQIIFDYPTIENDIRTRVEIAMRKFERI